MEFQRQQLAFSIDEMRQKRSDERNMPAVGVTPRPAVMPVPSIAQITQTAVVASSSANMPGPSNIRGLTSTAATKRPRANETAHNELAQQIADWPDRQPNEGHSHEEMSFDTNVIRSFLENAARFCLRNTPGAGPKEIRELVNKKRPYSYDANVEAGSEVAQAVYTAQYWQVMTEVENLMREAPHFMCGVEGLRVPEGMTVHYPSRYHARGETNETSARVHAETERATITEIIDEPAVPPQDPWVVRVSYPQIDAVMICDDSGDSGEIGNEKVGLSHGLSVRRDGAMLDFAGPPDDDVSLAFVYNDYTFRMRICADYIILGERFRVDRNGISNICLNVEEIKRRPMFAIKFPNSAFEAMRVRYLDSRARLEMVNHELLLTDMGRVVN